MKISKVDHRITAVGMLQNDGTRGIVYRDPSKGEELETLGQLVKSRSDMSANLYSVLNHNAVIFAKDKNKQKIIKEIIGNFSSIFTGKRGKKPGLYCSGVNVCDYDTVSQYIEYGEKPNIDFLGYESDEKLAQDIVAHALRNSLRRKIVWGKKNYFLPDIAVKLLLAIVIRADEKEYKLLPKEEVLAFVGYVRVDRKYRQSRWKDGKKITRQEDIVTSIKKKDVKVQVFTQDGKHMLMLSNSENVKKKYVADFLKGFAACAGEREQNQMVFQIRQLIVLFVYGPKQYDVFSENSEKNPWVKIPRSGEETDLFGDILEKDDMGNITAKKVITKDSFTEIVDSKGKGSIRAVHLVFDAKIRKVIISHYKAAEAKIIEEKGIDDSGYSLFWISHFETVVERFVKIRKKREEEYYRCGHICDMLWEEWLSYIAMKYIDLGKAVYYFGTPDLYALDSAESIKIGPVQKKYADGITSFDYEKIKAEETLIRNFATAVTFAENAFSNAVVKAEYRLGFDRREGDRADVLSYSDDKFRCQDVINENAWKRVMSYFGGAAIWEDMQINGSGDAEPVFLNELRKHMANIRNASFHFSTGRNPVLSENNTYAKRLFSGEYGRINQLIGEKYLSNNAIAFYPAGSSVAGMETGLYSLMKTLYCHVVEREAQIPAFNRIIKKKDVRVFVEDFLLKDNTVAKNSIFSDTKLSDKYLSSLYFLLKEIYYYGFLSDNDLLAKFDNALTQVKNKVYKENDEQKKNKYSKDISEKQAINSFIKRYNVMKQAEMTFGQMCQQIMTDYNMQNQKQKEIPSTAKSKWNDQNGNKPLYKHYVLILQQCIRRAFESYLDSDRNKVFEFLKFPKISQTDFEAEPISKERAEEFIHGIPDGIRLFEKVAALEEEEAQGNDGIGQDIQLMYDWYVTAHFMSTKQINMLIGDIRSYKQYVNNIYERAKNTGNTAAAERILDASILSRCSNILSVLEFVLQFAGKTSRIIEDYFDTHEEYAKYIANYVDFDDFVSDAASEEYKYKAALQMFCGQMVENTKSTDKALGIYYDKKNPVPNRNMVYSLLYGDTQMLSAVMSEIRENNTFRITKEEIVQYYEMSNQLNKVFKRGSCISDDEQELLKKFQNLKNRIELLDVQTYTELLNDIIAQMVSWAYLRERDLMCYQLGYHYVRLFYTNKVTETKYHVLKGEKVNIEEGALLYQIIALYDHKLPLYGVDQEGKAVVIVKSGTAGVCITPFMKEYCQEKDLGNPYLYYGGIRLFEDKNRHDAFVALRDYIAHMKYHTLHDKNIWDLFGEMYNGFLGYDTKLKKSVSYISKNILERHFVVLETSMAQGKGSVQGAVFSVEKMTSDTFTYKYKDENKKEHRVEVSCRSDIFLKQLEALLDYKK